MLRDCQVSQSIIRNVSIRHCREAHVHLHLLLLAPLGFSRLHPGFGCLYDMWKRQVRDAYRPIAVYPPFICPSFFQIGDVLVKTHHEVLISSAIFHLHGEHHFRDRQDPDKVRHYDSCTHQGEYSTWFRLAKEPGVLHPDGLKLIDGSLNFLRK